MINAYFIFLLHYDGTSFWLPGIEGFNYEDEHPIIL